MPLHWRKRWQRGFNQAELLAREIGRRTHTPVLNALRRVRYTESQAGLTSAKRRQNVSGAFQTSRRESLFSAQPLKGRSVLIIDDVITTGATAASCARALKRAGARLVTVLALARADRRSMLDPLAMSSKLAVSEALPGDSNFSGRSEDAQSRSFA
jgi:ComF family protein